MIQMANRQTYENMLNITDHQEMHITTTRSYHLLHIKIAIIKKINDNVLLRVWRTGDPCTLLRGMQISIAIIENCIQIPKKLQIK